MLLGYMLDDLENAYGYDTPILQATYELGQQRAKRAYISWLRDWKKGTLLDADTDFYYK